jgi:hypothetical protein
MIVFGPFCMAHPVVTADENMLRAEHEGRESEFSGMCVTLDRSLLSKCSRFLERIGSVVVAASANFKRYLRTNRLSLGGSGRICQARRRAGRQGNRAK